MGQELDDNDFILDYINILQYNRTKGKKASEYRGCSTTTCFHKGFHPREQSLVLHNWSLIQINLPQIPT